MRFKKPWWMRPRVDGVEAVNKENSPYTRGRTLPVEERESLRKQGFSDDDIDDLYLSLEQMLRGEGEVIRRREDTE